MISGNDGIGVHLKSGSSFNTIAGNRIGTDESGSGAIGNSSDGIKIEKSNGNIVGNMDAVESIDFYDAADGTAITQPVDGWQGIRGSGTSGRVHHDGHIGAERAGVHRRHRRGFGHDLSGQLSGHRTATPPSMARMS